MKTRETCVFAVAAMVAVSVLLGPSRQALAGPGAGAPFVWGIKASAGGRYDDVRMCIATDPGVKGGAAAEISLFVELKISGKVSATINLPFFRPLLFGAAFRMLQFEPDVFLNFRHEISRSLDLLFGPTVGLSLHHGPDYNSGPDDEQRGPSFFAMGPKLGAFVALDFKRPGQSFNFQFGLNPYVAPLFATGGPEFPDGIVAGGMLEGVLRFTTGSGGK